MEAVRREDAVERARRQAAFEVRRDEVERRCREAPGDAIRGAPERAVVAVDGRDDAACAEQGRQRERERALARAELEPPRAGALDAAPDERDMVVMVHAGIMPVARRPPAPRRGARAPNPRPRRP